MKFLILIVSLTIFSDCLRDKHLDDYYKIIDSSDKIIFYKRANNKYSITNTVCSKEVLQNLKNCFKESIKIEIQRKYIPTKKIELYNQNKLIGVLLINNSEDFPFVNFQNEKLGFGFKLTYCIDMSFVDKINDND